MIDYYSYDTWVDFRELPKAPKVDKLFTSFKAHIQRLFRTRSPKLAGFQSDEES